MDRELLVEELRKIILPLVEEENSELVDIEFKSTRQGAYLTILVESKDGKVDADVLARINHKLGDILDQLDIINERYTLEVSSPGLDRPLSTARDFERNKNCLVKFFLIEAISGKIEHDGLVREVKDEVVIVESKNGTLEIPLSKIRKAKQIIS